MSLHKLAKGEDARVVNPREGRKTISAETTFNDDYSDRETLENILWPLCEKVARQLRKEGITGRVAVLKLRRTDFKIITRRRTLPAPTQTARTLFNVVRAGDGTGVEGDKRLTLRRACLVSVVGTVGRRTLRIGPEKGWQLPMRRISSAED